ncbi:MAG: outer membrane lipoprotein-sorting protein [Pseudomonadales bacterium]
MQWIGQLPMPGVSWLLVGLGVLAGFCRADAGQTDPDSQPMVTARELVAGAIDLTRGMTSYAELSMIIHRPDWERTSNLVAWTRGRKDALIRFTAPAKDAGNATLKQGEKMWTFSPKLNRTIRLPFSLMSQSWAGSDFSYNDLSRTDKLLEMYDLKIIDTSEQDGHTIYTIEAVPHDEAPVVWGKEEMVLRDDHVLLSQTYYDQSMQALKRMETLEIGELDGRTFGTRMRMSKLDEPDNYTELHYAAADFDVELDDRLFTLFSLQAGSRP